MTSRSQGPHSTLIGGVEFLDQLEPPDFVVRPCFQRGQLAALTGPTGHGKSAFAQMLALSVAAGRPLGPIRPSRPGRVLLLFGENEANARVQLAAAALHYGIPKEALSRLLIYPLCKPLSIVLEDLQRDLGPQPLDFVNVDTSPAYFGGTEENDNTQIRHHAALLRRLTHLPGRPCVVANCHPTKAARRGELLPRGGGAFLAELDANVTLWNEDGLLEIDSTKLRGPPFEPFSVGLTHHTVAFTNGETQSVPVAIPLSVSEEGRHLSRRSDDEADLLGILRQGPRPFAELAESGPWNPSDLTVLLRRMARKGLIAKVGGLWSVRSDPTEAPA